MLKITKTATGATFRVRVQPGATKNEIMGVQEHALKVRISVAPVQEKPNKELIRFLAKQLGVKRTQVQILNGHATRRMTIQIVGEGAEIEKRIQTLLGIAKETT